MSDTFHPDLIGIGADDSYWKNIPKQTIFQDFNNPDPKQLGDCFRCCVAAVIGRPANEVPHFVQIGKDEGKNADALAAEWLWNNHNFRMMETSTKPWMPWFEGAPDLPMIVSGPTIRSKNSGHWHAVVMARGVVKYDPHPDGAGLLHEAAFRIIFSPPL